MSNFEHGRGRALVKNVEIPDELIAKMHETATHIYRDPKGNIINYIKCGGA